MDLILEFFVLERRSVFLNGVNLPQPLDLFFPYVKHICLQKE